MSTPEMRLDPLRGSWTLFCSERIPFCSKKNSETSAEENPFLEQHAHLLPTPIYTSKNSTLVRVIPNRTPLLRVEGDTHLHGDGIYDRMDAVGAHEVVIETAGSEKFEALSREAIAEIITAWKMRILDLTKDIRMRAFFVIKNSGTLAGGVYSHALSQIIAMAVVPSELRHKLEIARKFYEQKKRSLFEDILATEIKNGSRLIYENAGFVAFCPYASRTPFEISIYPKRQCADFSHISPEEIMQFSDALKTSLTTLDKALQHVSYQCMLTTAPTRSARSDYWTTIDNDFRWHMEIIPRLNPSGGFEIATGCSINPTWPEEAAEYLRNLISRGSTV